MKLKYMIDNNSMVVSEELYNQMESVQENINLSDEEKLKRLKEANGGTWYDGWKPYCCTCSYNGRMISTDYGFKCPSCGNMIGFNLTRLKESPLNKKKVLYLEK